MKIINIVPGFGGAFYCGNCLRDSAFIKALKATGHEALTLPIYLPLSGENTRSSEDLPVFYGAISIYLKQKFPIFRNMPSWLERFFNAGFFLKFAAKKAGSTRAEGLEEMTISMLKGHQGYQKEELQQLIDYLKYHEKPDIIHLSNALLMGLAFKLKEELGVKVVCSLQDEDVWIDAMRDSYQEKLWNLFSEKANDVDAFVAVSHYFAGIMQKKMSIPEDKLHVVHIGVEPHNYEINIPTLNPPVIGYLSRMNHENGFDQLIDAFIYLKEHTKYKNARLKVSGGHTGDDNPFIRKQLKKLQKKGFHHDIEFYDHFSGDQLNGFFHSLTVLTVPVWLGEAFGLYQLEALASGIPVVQPAVGAFPEVVELTGGGLIYEPNNPQSLAGKWEELFNQPDLIQQLSLNGLKAVNERFNVEKLTQKMIDIYTQITSEGELEASVGKGIEISPGF